MKLRTLTTTLALALISATSMTPMTTAHAKTFVYCSEGSPEGFSPMLYSTGTTFEASSIPMFNTLVDYISGPSSIGPALAESWEISEDGRVYTFHLRKGVKFHSSKTFKPSRDFNADDVIWTYERQRDRKHPYHQINGGSYPYFFSTGLDTLIDRIEKLDDYTVKFVLTRPESPFLATLTMDFASITSAEYADQLLAAGTPEKIDLEPIGTGPFQFVAYQKDAQIRYKAFPDYWNKKPAIDTLVYSITPDTSVAYAKLKTGECQAIAYPNPADIPSMKQDPNITVYEKPGMTVGYLAFNTQKEPFNNKLVRQALNLAVNKKAILDAIYQGSGTIAKNPIPPTLWSYNDEIEDYPYDPEKAKKLLKDAGYPEGFTTDLWAMPVQRPYNPNARRMAEMIQEDWAKIGVKTEIKTYEWGEYLKRAGNYEHSTLLLGWQGDNGDPDNFFSPLLSCNSIGNGKINYAAWCNKEFSDLVQQARTISDQNARTDLYKKAQEIFKEEAPWIPIAHSMHQQPFRKNVIGYEITPRGLHVFTPVDLQ